MIKHQTKSIKIKIKMVNNRKNINNTCRCRVISATLSWRLFTWPQNLSMIASKSFVCFYLLQGTNFELDSLVKFNIRSAASPYYITLVARLPSSGLQQIFQVLVEEECLGILDLTCPISRPEGKDCFVYTLINFTTFDDYI